MENQKTFKATIALGLREGYTDVIHSIKEVYDFMQEYCNIYSLCVTVTETMFIYKDGSEKGCFIELIQYPRFPTSISDIKFTAFTLAKKCMEKFNQLRVSVICTDETFTLENESYF